MLSPLCARLAPVPFLRLASDERGGIYSSLKKCRKELPSEKRRDHTTAEIHTRAARKLYLKETELIIPFGSPACGRKC